MYLAWNIFTVRFQIFAGTERGCIYLATKQLKRQDMFFFHFLFEDVKFEKLILLLHTSANQQHS